MVCSVGTGVLQNKKCADRNQRTKTQIRTVAKQVLTNTTVILLRHSAKLNLHFIKFMRLSVCTKKGYNTPSAITIFGRVFILLVWHLYYITIFAVCKYIKWGFIKAENKKPPLACQRERSRTRRAMRSIGICEGGLLFLPARDSARLAPRTASQFDSATLRSE